MVNSMMTNKNWLKLKASSAKVLVASVIAMVAVASLFFVSQRSEQLDKRQDGQDKREQALRVIEREIERKTYVTGPGDTVVITLPPVTTPTTRPRTVSPPTTGHVTVPTTLLPVPGPGPTVVPTPTLPPTAKPPFLCRAVPPVCNLIAAQTPPEPRHNVLSIIAVIALLLVFILWIYMVSLIKHKVEK